MFKKATLLITSLILMAAAPDIVIKQPKITIHSTSITLADAFAQIEKQTGLSIAYSQSQLDTDRAIALSLDDAALDEAMTAVLKSTNLAWKLNGYHIVLQKRKNFTVSGRVVDEKTGEALIGCAIYSGERGTNTNAYGFFSLTLPAGEAPLKTAMMGYKAFEQILALDKDITLNIALQTQTTITKKVVVTPHVQTPLTARPGVVNVPIEQIQNAPVLLGESDLMKSLQYIAGVQGTVEGKADLSVRGGSPDQNLILLDGNPVYNANHMFGLMSVFNTDALKNVTLYKGGFPARFGGRLSSVIDVNTKDGDKEHFGGSATWGLLAMKFNVEGPIIKKRTSFTLSGRRSWIDAILRPVQAREESKTLIWFYDINAKLHHRINDRNSIYLTFYNGRDRLRTIDTWSYRSSGGDGGFDTYYRQTWQWGSTIAAARLGSILTNNLFMNANVSFNRYGYSTGIIDNGCEVSGGVQTRNDGRIDYTSGIRDYTASLEFEYSPAHNHLIRMGAQGVYHDFRPETLSVTGAANISRTGGKVPAQEFNLYAEDDWEVIPAVTLGIGLRGSFFHVHGKTYSGVDPRLSATWRVQPKLAVKASYAQMQQYIHLLSNNSLLLQTDLWVPTTGRIKPMNSRQWSLGGDYALPAGFFASLEGYYKEMNNVLEYKDGTSFAGSSSGWEDKVEAGKGRAYGVEVTLERRMGKTTGAVSYTWALSERKFNEINFGEWFFAKYDRRHTFHINVMQTLSRKFDLMAAWTYTSGMRATLPMMTGALAVQGGFHSSEDYTQLDGRNNFRAPSYHRLDLGIKYHPRRWKHPSHWGEWSLNVYNAYNRMNAFNFYIDTWSNPNRNLLGTRTMFPCLPSFSYTYNF